MIETLVVVLNITLYDYSKEEPSGLTFVQLFTEQPSIEDVIAAFDREPLVRKRDDYDEYRTRLIEGLNTYGIPRLNQLKMTDRDGTRVATPIVSADWKYHAVGVRRALDDIYYGSIRVSYRMVTPVKNTESTQQPQRARNPALRKSTKKEAK